MNSAKQVSDEDLRLLFAYLDGELSEEAATDLEHRLAGDPELARRCESLARADEAFGRLHGRPAPRVRGHWGLVAAAATILAVSAAWWLLQRPEPIPVRVAVLPGDATLVDYQARIGQPGLVAPDERGGEADPEREEKLARLRAAVEGSVRQALAGNRSEAQAGYYYVALEVSAPTRAVIIEFPTPGEPHIRYPFGDQPPELWVSGTHLLPGKPLLDEGLAESGFQRGYLVTFGVDRVKVLGAMREHLDVSDVRAIRSQLEGASVEEMRGWLESEGYACFELSVEVPQGF